MKNIEEVMEELRTTIINYHTAEDFSARLYRLKRVFKQSKELNSMLVEELEV